MHHNAGYNSFLAKVWTGQVHTLQSFTPCGVNLWRQTTVGGWVWLKSHLDLVCGTGKIAMGSYGGVSFGFSQVILLHQLPLHFKAILFWPTRESKVVLINHPIKSVSWNPTLILLVKLPRTTILPELCYNCQINFWWTHVDRKDETE